MTAVLLLPHDAPEDEWLARRREGIGASEIAAVMGVSPWDSPFSLWWKKHEGWDEPVNEEMSAGRRLESVIAEWFAEQHEDEINVRPTGLWASGERPWQLATPDRLLMFPRSDSGRWRCGALLECKAAYSWDGWGEPGTDEVPVHYRAQCLWQMDTVGVDLVYLAAFSGLSFRQYQVRRDEKDLAAMREAGRRFMDSLESGEQPDVDEHSATLPILRRVHSLIEDREQEIPAPIAEGWLRSRRFADLADRCKARYTAQLRHHLGSAKTATLGGRAIAARTSNDQLRSKA